MAETRGNWNGAWVASFREGLFPDEPSQESPTTSIVYHCSRSFVFTSSAMDWMKRQSIHSHPCEFPEEDQKGYAC